MTRDAGPAPEPRRRFTLDDLSLFPDDGKRHEIIDGEHFVTPVQNARHQRVLRRLSLAIRAHLRHHPDQGEALTAPFDVILSLHDVVEPDLLVITGDQASMLTERNVDGAPALVVEVVSGNTRTRDEQIKHRLFEREGIGEYWLLDPDLETITIFRAVDAGTLAKVETLEAAKHEALTTPLLAGFALSLQRLFAQ